MPAVEDAEDIPRRIHGLLEARGADRALLFGSWSRHTQDRRSDIDLIVIDDAAIPYLRRLDKYYDALVVELGRPVDLFVYTHAELENMRELPFLAGALEHAVVVYERRP